MDFHSMKRKQLQQLCKKNGIPANLTNLELAERLTLFFEEKEKLDVHGENESVEVERKVVKKVRFSPRDEVFEIRNSNIRVASRRKGRGKNLSLLESDDNVAKSDDLEKNVVKRLTRKSVAIKNRVRKSVIDEKLSDAVGEEIGGKKGRIVRRSRHNVDVLRKGEDSTAFDEKLDHQSGKDGRMITRLRSKVVLKGVSSGAESRKVVKNVVADEEQEVVACTEEPELKTQRKASKRKSFATEDQVFTNTEPLARDVLRTRSMKSDTEQGPAETEASGNLLKTGKKDLSHDGILRRSQRRASSFSESAVIGYVNVGIKSNEATGRGHLKEKLPPEQACGTVQNVRRSRRNVPRDDSLDTSEKKEKGLLTSSENDNDKNVPRTRRKQVVSVDQIFKVDQEPPVKISCRRSARISSKHDSVVNKETSSQDEPTLLMLEVKVDRNIEKTKMSKKRMTSSKRQNKFESNEGSLSRDDEEIAKDTISKKRYRSKKKDSCIEICTLTSEVDEGRDALMVTQESSTLKSLMKLLDAPDNVETQASHEIINISFVKEKEKVVQMDAYVLKYEEDCQAGHNGLSTEHGVPDDARPEELIPVERELSPEEISSPFNGFSPSELVEENRVNDLFMEENLMVERRDSNASTVEAERPLSYHTEMHYQVMCGEETFCRNDFDVANNPSKLQGVQEEDNFVVGAAPSLEQDEAFSHEHEAIHRMMTEGEASSCNIKSGSISSRMLKGSVGVKENEDEETAEKRLAISVGKVNNTGEVFEENLAENRRHKVILVEGPGDGFLDNKENTIRELESINLLDAAPHLGTQISNKNSEVLVEKDKIYLGKEKENEVQMEAHGQKDEENIRLGHKGVDANCGALDDTMPKKLVSPERELSPDEIVSSFKGLSPSEPSVTVDKNVDILKLNEELESAELSASELRHTSYDAEKHKCGDETLCSNSADGFHSPLKLQEIEQCFEKEQALIQKDEIVDGTMPEAEILSSDTGAGSTGAWNLREPSEAKEEEQERTAEKQPVTPIFIVDNNNEVLGENLNENSKPEVFLDEAPEEGLLDNKQSLGSETSLNYSLPIDSVGTPETSVEEAAPETLQRRGSDSIQSFDKVSVIQETNSDVVKFLLDGTSIEYPGSQNDYTNRSACKHISVSASLMLPTDQCEAPTSSTNSLDRKESLHEPLKCTMDVPNNEDQEDFSVDEMQTRVEETSESDLEKDALDKEIWSSALLPSALNKLSYEKIFECPIDDRSNTISNQHSSGYLTTEQTEKSTTFDNEVGEFLPHEMCITNSPKYVVKEILSQGVAEEVLDGENKMVMADARVSKGKGEYSDSIGHCLYLVHESTEVDPALGVSNLDGQQSTVAEMNCNSSTISAEKNCEGSEIPEENRTSKMIEHDTMFSPTYDMWLEEETIVTTQSACVMSHGPQVSDCMMELVRMTHDPSGAFCTESLLSEAMEEKIDMTKKNSGPFVPEVSTMDVWSDRKNDAPTCTDLYYHNKEVIQDGESYLADGSSGSKGAILGDYFVFDDDNSGPVTFDLGALSPSTNEVLVYHSEEVNVAGASENDFSSKKATYAEGKAMVKTIDKTDMLMNVEYTGIPTGLAGMFHVLEDQLDEDAKLTAEALQSNDAHEDAGRSVDLYDIYVEIMQHPDQESFGELEVLRGLIPESTTIFGSLDVENVETVREEEDIQTFSGNANLIDKKFVLDKIDIDASPPLTSGDHPTDNKVLDEKLRSIGAIKSYLEDKLEVSIDTVAEGILDGQNAATSGNSSDQVERPSTSSCRSDRGSESDLNIAGVNLFNSASCLNTGSGNELESQMNNEVGENIDGKELADEARDEGITIFGEETNDFVKTDGLRSGDDLKTPQDAAEWHSDGHERAVRKTDFLADADHLELSESSCKTESKLAPEESGKDLDSLRYLFDEVVDEEPDTSAEHDNIVPEHEVQPDLCTDSSAIKEDSRQEDVKEIEDVPCLESSFTQIGGLNSPAKLISEANKKSEINDASTYPEKSCTKVHNTVQNDVLVTMVGDDTKSDAPPITRSDNAKVKADNAACYAIENSDGIKETIEFNETSLHSNSTTNEPYPGDLAIDTAAEGTGAADSSMMKMNIFGINSGHVTPKKLSWTQDMKENATAGVQKAATNMKSVIKRRALQKIQNN